MSWGLWFLALPCVGWGIAILGLAVFAWITSAKIRINMSCVAGALLCAIAIGMGWQYGRGDVGMSSGWTLMTILGCYISMVSPIGGFVQIVTLLADIGVAHDLGMGVESGYEWLVMATLGSVLVLVSIMFPLGPNLKGLAKNDSLGRLLTISKAKESPSARA